MKTPSFLLIIFISLAICACENPLMNSILQPKTITFESNGAGPVPPQTLIKNEKISIPKSPVREGYFFLGWFTDNDTFKYRWDFNTIPEEDMTLYAAWYEKPTPTEKDFIIKGADYVEYDGSPKVVTITAYPGKTGGKITVYYQGTGDTENTITLDAPTSPGTYLVTFDVAAAEGWNAADGLYAGILTIIMSVKVNQTPVASDFNIGGALTFTYDGFSKNVTIEPKTGKSQGAVTVYYNGNTVPPVNIGTYIVTFDVAPADGWYAAYGLEAGTLNIIAANPNNKTPVAGDYTIDGNGTFIYNGSAKAVTVTPNTGKSQGTIIIKYNGHTTAPTNAGTYSVTFDVAVADGWNSAIDLSAGTITISKATPDAKDFDISGLTHYYDGNAKAVTISPMIGKSPGVRTVYYEKETDTTKSETPPSNVGTYIITFDVAESENWNAVNGLFAGLLTINKGTLSASDYDIDGLTQTYNGSAKTVTFTPKMDTIPGSVTIYYNNSTTAPINAGDYTVTFDVAADTTGNWNPANGLSAGKLTINKATPVKDDYDISNNLTQNVPYPDNNNISAVAVTVKANGIRSPGSVTVYYEGINGTTYPKSTTRPSNIGSYAVTFNVAASTDENWNSASLSAGTLKINVFETVAALGTWLGSQNHNDITTPYPVALNVRDLGGNGGTSGSAGFVINTNTKYVNLDLSGSTITTIQNFAFSNYFGNNMYVEGMNLVGIIIPNSVTSIEYSAFWGCSGLTAISIPNSVTSIDLAFSSCNSLISINVDTNNKNYSSEQGVLYNKNKTTLIQFPGGKTGAFTILDGVTSIGINAFSHCTRLTSVTIPNSVTSIGSSAFWGCSGLTDITIPDSVTSIGSSAFFDCTSLTSINIDANNKNYSSEQGVLYNKNKTILIQYPGGKTDTSFTIPNGVTSIENYTFYNCTRLTSITIPNSVTSIGHLAFNGCISITNITIPDSVTSIEERTFYSCNSLASVTIGNGVTSIGNNAFMGCTSLTSITIPNKVTSIGREAFAECDGLTSVTFAGTIPSNGFSSETPFPGDLRDKFYVTNPNNGTPGTYITSDAVTWTKAP